jgi:hypothetical protein
MKTKINLDIGTPQNPDFLFRPYAKNGNEWTPLVHDQWYLLPINGSNRRIKAQWKRGMGQKEGLFVTQKNFVFNPTDVASTGTIIKV